MKKIVILSFIILTTSCKPGTNKQRTIADADFTDNKVVHLTDKDGGYTTLEDLVAQHKGAIVYVDLWASWCGPCKEMMPASAALQQYYKGKKVVFIYISLDDKLELWEHAATNFKLKKEESFLARNYPKAQFFQDNIVSNIPRYFLFDKAGRLLDDDALNPAEPELKSTIDQLLAL